MNNIYAWLAGVLVVVGAVMVGLFLLQSPMAISHRLTVATTIFPLADMVRQIAGGEVEVVVLIPPGTTEHSSELSPQILAAMERSRALFAIGHGLDDQIVSRVHSAYQVPVVIVDKGIALREFGLEEDGAHDEHEEDGHGHSDEGVDPHYWLSVSNAVLMARTVTDELKSLDPEQALVYERSYEKYKAELVTLHGQLRQQAGALSQKHFVSMHNAWGYFAEAYGLELVGTYEPTEGHEPSLTELQELQVIVDRYGITAFYAEPQKASTAAVTFLRNEFDLEILTLDPVGGLSGVDSYIKLMRKNMEAMAAGSR